MCCCRLQCYLLYWLLCLLLNYICFLKKPYQLCVSEEVYKISKHGGIDWVIIARQILVNSLCTPSMHWKQHEILNSLTKHVILYLFGEHRDIWRMSIENSWFIISDSVTVWYYFTSSATARAVSVGSRDLVSAIGCLGTRTLQCTAVDCSAIYYTGYTPAT